MAGERLSLISEWPGDDRTHVVAFNPAYIGLLTSLCARLLYHNFWDGTEQENIDMDNRIEELMYLLMVPIEQAANMALQVIEVAHDMAVGASAGQTLGAGDNLVNNWCSTLLRDDTGEASVVDGHTLILPKGEWFYDVSHVFHQALNFRLYLREQAGTPQTFHGVGASGICVPTFRGSLEYGFTHGIQLWVWVASASANYALGYGQPGQMSRFGTVRFWRFIEVATEPEPEPVTWPITIDLTAGYAPFTIEVGTWQDGVGLVSADNGDGRYKASLILYMTDATITEISAIYTTENVSSGTPSNNTRQVIAKLDGSQVLNNWQQYTPQLTNSEFVATGSEVADELRVILYHDDEPPGTGRITSITIDGTGAIPPEFQ